MMTNKIVFIDTEVTIKEKKVCDIGAIKDRNVVFHSASISQFYHFIADAKFICGHNIIHHDLKYLPFAKHSHFDRIHQSISSSNFVPIHCVIV